MGERTTEHVVIHLNIVPCRSLVRGDQGIGTEDEGISENFP